MFKTLFTSLVNTFSFLNIFQYISFRAAYAAVTALLISFFFGPAVIKMLTRLKIGQSVRTDGPETHLVKAGTPTMGGALIILSVVISTLLWQDLHLYYTWILLLTLVGFGAIGFIDDYLKISRKSSTGLQSRFKFISQILVASLVVFLLYYNGNDHTTLLYIPFLKNQLVDLGWGFIPFGVFTVVAFSNAVNLTDGLDGLAAGLFIIAILALTIIAYLSGHSVFADYLQIPYLRGSGELTILCLALLGATVGFLWFNCHPSEIFMGDTGSLALGAIFGVISLILKKEILSIIIGGVFVLETLSVIIQVIAYKNTGKRVFKMAPLHHHFELIGWTEGKVVTRLWIVGGMFAILALSTLKIR